MSTSDKAAGSAIASLVPGITNRYCSHPSRRPLRGLLRMRSNLLKHNNLMLRSERRERLEAWAASDQPISHSSVLERGDFSSNRHPAPSFCLSMISGQTLCVCPEGKPVPTFPDHAPERFQTKWSLAGAGFMQTASVDLVQRGEQRTPRCPGGDGRDQRSLRRQRQITGRAQRKRPQQSCELIS